MLCGANKPFSVQTITDNLAQYGIKKGQVQKAAEMLAADGGTVIAKVRHCIALIVIEVWHVPARLAGRDLCPSAAGIRQNKTLLSVSSKHSSCILRGAQQRLRLLYQIGNAPACPRAASLLVNDIA